MRRLGAVLLLILLVAGMNVRSVWSGGGKWGDGSPAGDRTDAYWLPDGATPTGRPFPDVAIGGVLQTTLQSASWSLGIPDFLADLSPNTASFTFVGQISGTPGDDVVVSTGLGVQWAGRLDTVTQTRDVNGDWWTTITATDRLGALGAAELALASLTPDPAQFPDDWVEYFASVGSVPITVVDVSETALNQLQYDPTTYTGTVLAAINDIARASNSTVALRRDGDLAMALREPTTPSSVLTLTGDNAPQSWSLAYSIDTDINRWVDYDGTDLGSDPGDILLFGDRPYTTPEDWIDNGNSFDAWIAYGGSQRPTASGTFFVSSWDQDDLILLDPFQWVTESGTDWQVLQVQHSVTANPYSWTVTITADNLLDLL